MPKSRPLFCAIKRKNSIPIHTKCHIKITYLEHKSQCNTSAMLLDSTQSYPMRLKSNCKTPSSITNY